MSRTSLLQPLSPYSSSTANSNIETHTLSVLVDNEPGVLARVVGMFAGRGYNIESLTVAEVAHETHLSRITIVTSGTPEIIEQIRHQLERLVPVHTVNDLTLSVRAIERELAMIKVKGKGENRVEAMRLADAFRAKVIDATTESFIFELTGAPRKIDDFVERMRPIGLVEVSRTGVAAISRGPEPIKAPLSRLYVIHQLPIVRRRARPHLGERATVQHVGDGVSRFDHDQSNGTGFEIAAIVARSERCYGGAGQGRQRTIESAHDRPDPDLMRRTRQRVAATFALLGVDEARVSEFGQDMIEELFRDRVGLGDFRDLSKRIRFQSGKMDHRLKSVFPLLREHNLILIFGAAETARRRQVPRRIQDSPNIYKTRTGNTKTVG